MNSQRPRLARPSHLTLGTLIPAACGGGGLGGFGGSTVTFTPR